MQELRSKNETYTPCRNCCIVAIGFQILFDAKDWVIVTYYFETLL